MAGGKKRRRVRTLSIPHYHDSIAAAWTVIRRLDDLGFWVRLEWDSGTAHVEINKSGLGLIASADGSEASAIVTAALEAVRIISTPYHHIT
jgi:hypothetical protein